MVLDMKLKIREQSGTDAVRKFDYQMAVAIDYLLSEIDNDVIVLIETLEDFAIFRNIGLENQTVDVYQVKTKDRGLYSKSLLKTENVLGKIILTDFYFDSKSETLNIVCNTSLHGKSTQDLDSFVLVEKMTQKDLTDLKNNVEEYLKNQEDFKGKLSDYWGKLVYIKSSLPFSSKDDRYSETLVGKTYNTIAHYLKDDNHTINPYGIFNTLKLLVDKQRRTKLSSSEVEIDEALYKKGIRSKQVREVIDQAATTTNLSKNEILNHAATIFDPREFSQIKQEYATFLAYRSNLSDRAFIEAKMIIEEEYERLTFELDTMHEIIRKTANNCAEKISYYSLPVIQILTIVVVYS